MKRLSAVTTALFSFFVTIDLHAQLNPVAIGQWREHTPYNKSIDVAEDNSGTIYCASQYGMFSFRKSDGEINRLSRLDQLSDQEIAAIEYDHENNVLLIAYANANIDLIFSDKSIVNLPEIKTASIIGGKQINAVRFVGHFAYLCCEFGIVVIDIQRKEISSTWYIGSNGGSLNINGLAFDGTYFIAATDSGMLRANINDPNIFNYTGWTRFQNLADPNAVYTSVTNFNNKFYAVKTSSANNGDSVLVYDNNEWSTFLPVDSEGAMIDSYNNFLIYKNVNRISAYDASGNLVRNIDHQDLPYGEIRNGFIDAENNFWVADFSNGLVRQHPDYHFDYIYPNGPRSSAVWNMAGKDGRVWVATGGISGDNYIQNAKNGIYYLSDNNWKTFDVKNDSVYNFLASFGSPAVLSVAIDPLDADHAFIGAWGNGILEYTKDGGIKRYNQYNSPLYSLSNDFVDVRVGGVTFDPDGNLWAVTSGGPKSLTVKKRDGNWQDFTVPNVSDFSLFNLTVDDFGQKWFSARRGSEGRGLCVVKENSLDNPATSFIRLLNVAGLGNLPDLYVRCITKDQDGAIWLGTDKGVGVIYNPGNVFTGQNYDAQRIILEQDGYNQYLLETEIVTSIVVDGANRKWIGTYNGGAFLMSPDGTKQILHFDKTNSPLPSNVISTIAIDGKTGEVFFGTDKGIISYRSDATEGDETCVDYYVYPNPVRHEYHGPIAIRGLVANADVKITDAAGNIIYHTRANGGEAIWNGNNYRGERAQTGVYMVYVTNEDGSQTCTTKMLFGN